MQKTLRPAASILSRPASRFGKAVNPRPALLSPSSFKCSLVQLFKYSLVQLFKYFSTSSFRVPCSNVLPSRVEMKIFTLIELLIVVAIIAILAGMLLPALNAARDKAKAIQCSGNFSSIGKAAMMYAADWHDYLPPGSNGDNSSDPNRKRLWGTGNTGAIAEYLNCVNDPILIGYVDWPLRSKFACPADSKQTDHYTLGYNMQLNNQVYRKR